LHIKVVFHDERSFNMYQTIDKIHNTDEMW
jgi:hypothetical protein